LPNEASAILRLRGYRRASEDIKGYITP